LEAGHPCGDLAGDGAAGLGGAALPVDVAEVVLDPVWDAVVVILLLIFYL
jgi:hypothetical protein